MMVLNQSASRIPRVLPLVPSKCMIPRWNRWYMKLRLFGSGIGPLVGKPQIWRFTRAAKFGSVTMFVPGTVETNVLKKFTDADCSTSGATRCTCDSTALP